jgi:hypothetical protein
MTSQHEELQLLSVFGSAVDTATLVSVHRKEWSAAPWRHRTFLLTLDVTTNVATLKETIQRPIHESWTSPTGTVYCPTNNGEILERRDGRWHVAKVCDRDQRFGQIIGFRDRTEVDALMMLGKTTIFIRSQNAWRERAMPDNVTEMWRLHGISFDDVYVTTDAGLFRWNGDSIEAVEGPDDEVIDVMVTSPGELLAVGERVHRWRDGEGWSELDSPAETHARGMCRADGRVFIPSRSGVFLVDGDQLVQVFDFASNLLICMAGEIIGAGTRGGACRYDGQRWLKVELPAVPPMENA